MLILKDFIKSKYNFISFAVALLPSILLWILQPSESIPYWLFAILFLLFICMLWLALMTYFHLLEKENSAGLSIIECIDNLILCHPSSGISINVIVTIYENKNKYEHILGYGYILNIQQNGIIQIKIIKPLGQFTTAEDLVSYISSNSGNIIIKTTATIDTIQMLNERND